MTTTTIRQQLHNYLEVADDKKVKAIYIMMEEEIKESAIEYIEEFKAELDQRQEDYKSGKSKIFTPVESKNRIAKILKTKRN